MWLSKVCKAKVMPPLEMLVTLAVFFSGLSQPSLCVDSIGVGPHSFDYIIGESSNFRSPVKVLFVDYEINPSTIKQLRDSGKRVFCYVNAGAWEDWRSDASEFPDSVLGNDYNGWPGEKWLDIRQISVIMKIMNKRLTKAAAAGCEGIEPDNINGFEEDTGFSLTSANQLAFNKEFATSVRKLGMLVGLKNDGSQAEDLVNDFDFVVTESCMFYDECSDFDVFISQNKPVFGVEYTHSWTQQNFSKTVCPQMNTTSMSFILKKVDAKNDYTYSCFFNNPNLIPNPCLSKAKVGIICLPSSLS